MNSRPDRKFTVAAMGDLHVREHVDSRYRDLFAEIEAVADVLILCGDLTDSGTPKEAERLVTELSGIKIPVLGVLGNHDYHGDRVGEVKKIMEDGKLILLEDQAYEVGDVGFLGTKGFGGGFGRYMLASFGELMMKHFAEESIREALKLESALQNIKTTHKIVVLHYSPILGTVHGEPPEIYPFLGSSRLGEVIQRFDVDMVLHGHAHLGTFEGSFPGGGRVYNCSQDVLKRQIKKPYALLEVG
jgi:Icc-related predicted phosphoesterase